MPRQSYALIAAVAVGHLIENPIMLATNRAYDHFLDGRRA
jgi:hypothetical protein